MKKIMAFALTLVLLLVACPISLAKGTEESNTFDAVLLQKGTLIVQENLYFDTIKTTWRDIKMQTVTLINVATGSKLYALRLEHKADRSTSIVSIDIDEIDGVITTLKYIKAHINELEDYSEIRYKTNSGLIVGAYYSSNKKQIFFEFKATDTEFIEIGEIDSLISKFEAAKQKLGQ